MEKKSRKIDEKHACDLPVNELSENCLKAHGCNRVGGAKQQLAKLLLFTWKKARGKAHVLVLADPAQLLREALGMSGNKHDFYGFYRFFTVLF